MTTYKSGKKGRPRKLSLRQGLETTRDLFLHQGYDNLGVAKICAELNITPTSLYAAYKSKKALFIMVVDDYALHFKAQINDLLLEAQSGAELMRAVLEFAVEECCINQASQGNLLFDTALFISDDEIVQHLAQQKAELAQVISSRLHELHSEHAEELTQAILTFMHGISASARSGSSFEELLITVEFFCSALED